MMKYPFYNFFPKWRLQWLHQLQALIIQGLYRLQKELHKWLQGLQRLQNGIKTIIL